jgi:hypothetical protein
VIKSSGFKNVEIKRAMKNIIPEEMLMEYLSADELDAFRKLKIGIYSITVTADK